MASIQKQGSAWTEWSAMTGRGGGHLTSLANDGEARKGPKFRENKANRCFRMST